MISSVGADTNVLFSGFYYGGSARKLLELVRFGKIDFWQSEYLKDELVEIAKRNGMNLRVLGFFYPLENVHIVTDESYFSKEEFASAGKLVRDRKDVPVYVFAKKMLSLHKIDFFVTGDNDLLQEDVRASLSNKIISLSEFNELAD